MSMSEHSIDKTERRVEGKSGFYLESRAGELFEIFTGEVFQNKMKFQ